MEVKDFKAEEGLKTKFFLSNRGFLLLITGDLGTDPLLLIGEADFYLFLLSSPLDLLFSN